MNVIKKKKVVIMATLIFLTQQISFTFLLLSVQTIVELYGFISLTHLFYIEIEYGVANPDHNVFRGSAADPDSVFLTVGSESIFFFLKVGSGSQIQPDLQA